MILPVNAFTLNGIKKRIKAGRKSRIIKLIILPLVVAGHEIYVAKLFGREVSWIKFTMFNLFCPLRVYLHSVVQ